jgi:hypothetical protein
MSDPDNSTITDTINDGRALLSSTFIEFCGKVRNNNSSILPAVDKPFDIRRMWCEREGIEPLMLSWKTSVSRTED